MSSGEELVDCTRMCILERCINSEESNTERIYTYQICLFLGNLTALNPKGYDSMTYTPFFYKAAENHFRNSVNDIWKNISLYYSVHGLFKTSFTSIFETVLCLKNINLVVDIGNIIERYIIFLDWFFVLIDNCGTNRKFDFIRKNYIIHDVLAVPITKLKQLE